MKKTITIAGFLFAIFSLTSCFDIHEKITVHSDRSGEIMLYVENSGIGGMLAMISDNAAYAETRSMVDSLANYLAHSKGITKVEYNLSPYQGDLYMKVAFERSRYFNRALYGFFGYSYLSWFKKYITVKRHKVKRMNVSPFANMYMEKNSLQPDYQSYLGSIKVITELDVPGEITKVEGENCKTEERKVVQTFTVMSILYNKKSTYLKVKYK